MDNSLYSKLVNAILIGNAFIALVLVIAKPCLVTVTGLYVSLSPIFLCLEIIDPYWLHVTTKGRSFRFFRAMAIWPITTYESIRYKKMVKRIKFLTKEIFGMDIRLIKTSQAYKELEILLSTMKDFDEQAKETYRAR